jgi:hypothetical protein
MVISKPQNSKQLQLTLYSGVALIVISMLFLGRGQPNASFAAQAFTVLAVPAFFYIVGLLVGKYLHTPLAAPGLIATGAWLVGVGLIHLYDQRILLPEVIQPYYWFIASLLAGALITITGHQVRIWMLVPLVPLVQANAVWATMSALGMDVKWMPALSFLLVLAWWELPIKSERWQTIYRASGVVVTLVVLLFSLWLPLTTQQSLAITWGIGAGVVALLGLRHGWSRMGPLSIILLVVASIWGLPGNLWPLAWIVLALVTVVFIEQLTTRDEKGKDSKTVEISEALAVVLSGIAALAAQLGASFGGQPPYILLIVLIGAGALMIWLGWRRRLLLAMHIGLWLVASAWALVYFIALPDSKAFGLWLALLASVALLIERVLSSRAKEKLKELNSITQTVARWPLADLVIGLSAAIILWAALHIDSIPANILATTCSIVVGIWIAAGLSYRLPVLLHVALWIAPLPYAVVLLIAAPPIWTLPLMGAAWQLLGVILLVIGHLLTKHRLAVCAPFFLVGYTLLGFGFTFASADMALSPISLLIVILACIGTSITVIANAHPVWVTFIDWILPRHRFPYAHKHVTHLFLFLGAWLSAIWLHLMLGYTGMPLSRQGMFLVGLAGLWFVLGQMLSSLRGAVGWPVVGAGWLMWLIGLLEVFFSPNEAVITMIVGLAVSGEALRRTRQVYWIPVFIVQVFFTVLQIAWMLVLPGWLLLMLVALAICIGGMVYEQRDSRAGRITAVMGGVLAVGVCLLHFDSYTLLGLTILTLMTTVVYRRWQWLWAVYGMAAVLVIHSGAQIQWQAWFVFGLVQMVLGLELAKELRSRRYRTLHMMLFKETDWATPFLWSGFAMVAVGWGLAFTNNKIDFTLISLTFTAGAVLTFYTIRLRILHLPNLILVIFSLGLLLIVSQTIRLPFSEIGNWLATLSLGFAGVALVVRWGCTHLLLPRNKPLRWQVWWIRPLLGASLFLNALSLVMLTILGSAYHFNLLMQVVNGLLLTVYTILVYRHQRRIGWLWITLLLAGYMWVIVGNSLQMSNILWYTIPIAAGLLAIARVTQFRESVIIETLGIAILLGGSINSLDTRQLLSPAAFVLAAHVLALGIYGYICRRRVPFFVALLSLGGGTIWMIMKINIWFIPLGAGMTLLTTAIVAEAGGTSLEHWVQGWIGRWQSWK